MKNRKKVGLFTWILIGFILGIALGIVSPEFGKKLKFLGTILTNLLNMVVVPLVMSLLITAAADVGSMKTEIGVPLFNRRQHPVKLTQAGQELIRYYQEVKSRKTDMLARIQDLAELRSGSLAVGGTHYLLSYVLPQTIPNWD